MVSKNVTIVCEQGLHMRPAGNFVKAAAAHRGCSITLHTDGKIINAKAIMQIMAAGMKKGCHVKIVCDGENEQAVLEEIAALLESEFVEA
jgi:phosphocarrier protein